MCTSCSRVFVVALPLTSTRRRALHLEHLSSSSVQTTRASHYVSRKMAGVSNPAARDRTVLHREQGRARCVPTHASKPVLFLRAISSSMRHVGCVGGVSTSGTSDCQASGHSRGFSKGSTRRDRISMTTPEKEAVFFVSPGFGADHHGLDKPREFPCTPRSASATEGCQEGPRESRGDRVMSHDKRICPEARTWHVQLF